MVEDRSNAPLGREPLSASWSHSQPRVFGASCRVCPADSAVAAVLRHRRSWRYAYGTVMRDVPLLTRNDWPVSAFSGVFVDAVVNRGSRQLPVHVTGSVGASKCVSLYATSVRSDVFEPSMLGSQRVF